MSAGCQEMQDGYGFRDICIIVEKVVDGHRVSKTESHFGTDYTKKDGRPTPNHLRVWMADTIPGFLKEPAPKMEL
jgi:hypothetical protein